MRGGDGGDGGDGGGLSGSRGEGVWQWGVVVGGWFTQKACMGSNEVSRYVLISILV